MWDTLSILDDCLVIVDGIQDIHPFTSKKTKLLEMGHRSHCGAQKMKTQFRQLYYWPGMANEIDNLVRACRDCNYHLPSQPKEALLPTTATSPMERIGVDIFDSAGKHYLCVIDRFSGFPFVAPLRSMTTSAVIKELNKIFLVFGYAGTLRTDNGPAFRSEFHEYCTAHGMTHETSSPHFPQSNGHAEKRGQNMQTSSTKMQECLGRFPAGSLRVEKCFQDQMGTAQRSSCFGRAQRTALPRLPVSLRPIDWGKAERNRQDRDCAMKKSFDRHSHDLNRLKIGDRVLTQDPITRKWNREGIVKECMATGRSYIIEFTDGGADARRNRRFIRKI